jgi:perosamine synthetase
MKIQDMRRRSFLRKTAVGTAGMSLGGPLIFSSDGPTSQGKPAILGGKPIRVNEFPSWPVIQENDEKAWMQVLRAKGWFRMNGDCVKQFEKEFAELMGSKDCLATANGTSSLFTSLNALGVGPGDEVIVPPYTFVATVNVVLLQHALPVFVDTDPATFQIDAKKIEDAITDRTRCIIPVHLGGNASDLDSILAVAKKHKIPVIEDACQAHLAEWRGKKVGTWGDAGCFSFQVSKNLCCGEGGAILSDSSQLIDRCFSFHSNGATRKRTAGFSYAGSGTNVRMTEFQGALLLQQLTRLQEQSRLREQNAAYLTEQLRQIPGIQPAKNYSGCTRNAYHLYMFRYDQGQFAGLARDHFLEALRAEGIPCSSGYTPLNRGPFLKEALYSRGYLAVYPRERVDRYFKNNNCPENDRLCQQAVWFTQTMLLGARKDMDQIVEAVRKLHNHAGELAKT